MASDLASVTLILGVVCPTYGVLVADRRYTPQENAADDERNKIVTVAGDNGRLAVAFTGLARVGTIFNTNDWIVDALYEALNPHGDIHRMLEETRAAAEAAFARLPPHARKETLSLVGVGFSYASGYALPLFFVITNDRSQQIIDWSQFADKRFGLTLGTNDSRRHEDALMLAYGWTQAVSDEELNNVQNVARANKSAVILKEKAAGLIQVAARRPAAEGRIGLQCGAAIVPAEPSGGIETDYIVGANSSVVYMPSHVTTHAVFKNARLWSDDGSPVAVPKAGRNAACPCGSGKKYKKCHYR